MPITQKKAFEIVLDWVETEIVEERIKVGSKLPGERDLAADLGVSRSAVREAIRVLEAQGVATASVGTGPNAGTQIAANQGRALARLLRIQVALANIPPNEVLEARVSLERTTVSMAAARATDQQLATMLSCLEAMDAPGMSIEEFNTQDTKFHVTIAQASNNQLLTDLTVAIRESLSRPIRQASQEIGDYEAFRRDLMTQHRAIFNAIVDQDIVRATALMEAHIRLAYAILPMNEPDA